MHWLEFCSSFLRVQYSDRIFAAKFGVTTEVCNYIYGKVSAHGLEPSHLLLTLNFLKCYNTLDAAHTEWQCSRRHYIATLENGLYILSIALNEVL